MVQIDGEMEDRILDESLSKERLAGMPFRFLTKCGRHFSISFNLETAQLTLKQNGEDLEKLPKAEGVP